MGLVPASNLAQSSSYYGSGQAFGGFAAAGQVPSWQQRMPGFGGDPSQNPVAGAKPALPPDESLATYVNMNMGQEIVPGGYGLGGRTANNHLRQLMLSRYLSSQLNAGSG